MELSKELQNKIINFLLSIHFLQDSDNQRAFIYHVGLDSKLQEQLILGKPLSQFIPLLVQELDAYGTLENGNYALEAAIETSKHYIGKDRGLDCENLLQELRAYREAINFDHTIDDDVEEIAGRNEVVRILQQALDCHQLPYNQVAGLHIKMESTSSRKNIIPIDIYIKSGEKHITEQEKNSRVKKHIFEKELWRDWEDNNKNVIFVWLKDTAPINAFWTRIHANRPKRSKIFIPKTAKITPITKYDFSLKFDSIEENLTNTQPVAVNLLADDTIDFQGKLDGDFRKKAKDIYKSLMDPKYINPLLGETLLTWRGWRHITSPKRRIKSIYDSLRLIPMIPLCIENPDIFKTFKRIREFQRGKWIYAPRLVVFKKELTSKDDLPIQVNLVLKEIIMYPTNWKTNYLRPYKKTKRIVSFESIYKVSP
ncbi:MAG: hypothetical protein GY801_52675 [bacterium]|nr:hypothetical protein [bacterium]